jgi:hypothetical protein
MRNATGRSADNEKGSARRDGRTPCPTSKTSAGGINATPEWLLEVRES